jgi:hypothetical protein
MISSMAVPYEQSSQSAHSNRIAAVVQHFLVALTK